jgi:hypothetical protein
MTWPNSKCLTQNHPSIAVSVEIDVMTNFQLTASPPKAGNDIEVNKILAAF